MYTRVTIRFIGVALVMAMAGSVAVGYIHFPPLTMPKMCKVATNIRVLSVNKHDKDKGVIFYDLAETLKGENKKDVAFRHVVRIDIVQAKPIFDWVGDGKLAVMFTIEGNGMACGYVFIDEFCYSVDYNTRGNYWLLIRVDPEMTACFHGSAKQLQKVAKDLLDGKDVKVPVKDSVKPLSLEEREKQVPALNEILIKNRSK
jgi:hypothetical protein